ncbi:hypothetical protein [Pectinatus frisingensis]|uniref:hypothetical protein n=1 Tax=Pectinatus frisingensis TaxID=865 RepID=UPI0018C6D5C3|nr:hypothetical protein [Pectinatus frisingensis]
MRGKSIKGLSIHSKISLLFGVRRLVKVAHTAMKCFTQPYKIKYERIIKRRDKKIAIARMIMTAVYHMFQTGEIFDPVGLSQIDMPPEMREDQMKTAVIEAVRFLK